MFLAGTISFLLQIDLSRTTRGRIRNPLAIAHLGRNLGLIRQSHEEAIVVRIGIGTSARLLLVETDR